MGHDNGWLFPMSRRYKCVDIVNLRKKTQSFPSIVFDNCCPITFHYKSQSDYFHEPVFFVTEQ